MCGKWKSSTAINLAKSGPALQEGETLVKAKRHDAYKKACERLASKYVPCESSHKPGE